MFDDFDLFVDLAGFSGVPSGNELSKRTTNDFEVLLHEIAHLFHASGLIFVISQVLHFFRIPLQVVELIFVKEAGAICPSNSDAQTSNVGHGFG